MPPPLAPMPAELATERLRLRLRGGRDAPVNLQLLRERADDPTPSVRRIVRPLEDEIVRLDSQRVDAVDRGFGLYAIDVVATATTVGYCGLIIGRVSADEPEVVYELLASAQRNGYATEAAQAVVDAAFGTGRRRLWASVRPWNSASFAVLERIGFVHDHTGRDEWGEIELLRWEAGAG